MSLSLKVAGCSYWPPLGNWHIIFKKLTLVKNTLANTLDPLFYCQIKYFNFILGFALLGHLHTFSRTFQWWSYFIIRLLPFLQLAEKQHKNVHLQKYIQHCQIYNFFLPNLHLHVYSKRLFQSVNVIKHTID